MAGFATLAALQAAAYEREFILSWQKTMSISGISAHPKSSWRLGGRPVANADPASIPGGTVHTNEGGLVLPDTSPEFKYLVGHSLNSVAVNYSLYLFDRLVSASGISLITTATQTTDTSALPRYTDGVGVMAFIEITTSLNASSGNVVGHLESYTNQDGTAGRQGGDITLSLGAADAVANVMAGPLPLQAGDVGIKSVESFKLTSAGVTAGAGNLVLVKPLIILGKSADAGDYSELDLLSAHFAPVRVYDGASLQLATTPSASDVSGYLRVISG